MRNRPAYSLLELALALVISATLGSLAMPALNHGRRVFAVRNASSEIVHMLALTRAAAVGAGGATLVLDLAHKTAAIEGADGESLDAPRGLVAEHGVQLESDRSSPLRLRYDALGIGRFTAATIRVRRDDVRATITVSAYGRVRW